MCHSHSNHGQRAGAAWAAERQGRAHFPWWICWMIWPLIALAKWLAPVYLAAATAVAGTLHSPRTPLMAGLALLLIVAGLALIREEQE